MCFIILLLKCKVRINCLEMDIMNIEYSKRHMDQTECVCVCACVDLAKSMLKVSLLIGHHPALHAN